MVGGRSEVRARGRVALLALVAIIALVYREALGGPFQFDDYAGVAVDRAMQEWTVWQERFATGLRPLLKLSFIVTHQLGLRTNDVALAHHLGNLLIHLSCTLLAYAIARASLRIRRNVLNPAVERAAALLVAAIFGLHPLATEAVAYISGRSVELATLFAFAALAAHIRANEASRPSARTAWRGVGVAALAAAIATRETAIMALAVLALWEVARYDPSREPFSARRVRPAIRNLAPYLVIAVLALVWLLTHRRYGALFGLSAQIAAGQITAPSFVQALGYFATRVLLLQPLSIDPDLGWQSIDPLRRTLGTIVGLALAAIAWRARRTQPHWLIGFAWVALWLAPTALIPARHDAISERHFYPAIWGAALLIGAEFARIAQRRQDERGFRHGRLALFGAHAAAYCLLTALALGTAHRSADYRSEVALWEATARTDPDKARAAHNLGVAYFDAERWRDAEAALVRAIELNPGNNTARDLRDRARAEQSKAIGAPS